MTTLTITPSGLQSLGHYSQPIRCSVRGNGCRGLTYTFEGSSPKQLGDQPLQALDEHGHVLPHIQLITDAFSQMYLYGVSIEAKDNQPQVTHFSTPVYCGCGASDSSMETDHARI